MVARSKVREIVASKHGDLPHVSGKHAFFNHDQRYLCRLDDMVKGDPQLNPEGMSIIFYYYFLFICLRIFFFGKRMKIKMIENKRK